MGTLYIINNKMIYNNEKFVLDDLFTADFLSYSDQQSKSFYHKSYFVNELFINTIQPYLAVKRFIEINEINKINCAKPENHLYAIAKDLSDAGLVKFEGKKKYLFLTKAKINAFCLINLSTIYLVYCMLLISRKDKTSNRTGDFIIIRTNSSEKKFEKFKLPKFFEDIKNKASLYSCFKKKHRVSWVIKCYFRSFGELKKIIKQITFSLGRNSAIIPFKIYSKRIMHTLLYEELLSAFFIDNKFETLYTGNNLDRFSIIEEDLTKKYGIKSIGIPHGLEYGFRFPKGFSTDLFYTTTSNAALHLNKLYDSKKFIFDQAIARKIFELEYKKTSQNKKVVFFTESREIEVNIEIIGYLLTELDKENIDLYIKLHPKDNENNYRSYQLNYIHNLEESLIGNICFSRKSTTLLECIYNNSKAAAILINAKDKALFSTFPSLNTSDIYVSESLESLKNWIKLNLNNKNGKL